MAEDADGASVALGIGLGLLGLGLAFAFLKARCPRCSAKVEPGSPYCPACAVMLTWPSR